MMFPRGRPQTIKEPEAFCVLEPNQRMLTQHYILYSAVCFVCDVQVVSSEALGAVSPEADMV